MDYKPIVTYCGARPLFRSLETHIVTAVPLDTCEWKRNYGRPIKNVRMEAAFQPFDTKLLDEYKSGDWSILKQPVLHIYITECNDVDIYRSAVKEEIEDWLKQLSNFGISDWMILLVETVDLKKSKNILPRTTVLDKMRLDFGSKNADRCISVLNPIKFEKKSTESFRCLLQRIRHLMLIGYNKNITKYEELIRANREKRNQEGWSFIKYFLLQEQLAFVLEMLGLPLEALIQYDELDAMFSQFVLNSVCGEKQHWLDSFSKPFISFNGITMNLKKMFDRRKKICENTATLLEFRSYVFERQATLLKSADQSWEIAERLLPFILTVLREIDVLKNDNIEGSLACWQFVCALEVLNLCDEQAAESKEVSNIFQHSAPIWNLAKDKLYELGKLCGLLPGCTPTSEQLHIVVQLSAGIGDSNLDEAENLVEKPVEKYPSPRKRKQSPTDRLKEALGSNQTFQKLYLELSELAISTYKHVSRLRSARLVGLDLGNFYCTLSEPHKAVVFFTDLLRELKQENWSHLASQTLLELASCYRKMNDLVAFVKTCAAIACCVELEVLVRTFYMDEFLSSLKKLTKIKPSQALMQTPDQQFFSQNVITLFEDHFKLLDINVLLAASGQIIQDDFINVFIKFESNFPRELLVNEIAISFEMQPKDAVSDVACTELLNNSMVPMTIHLDYKQDNTLSSASVVCALKSTPKQMVRRTSSTRRKVSPTVRNDFTNMVSTNNVAVKPGINVIELKSKATRVGMWNFRQISIVIENLEFLSESITIKLNPFAIITKPATAELRFDNLIAGIVQPINLVISGGSFIFPKLATINLKCSKNLKMRDGKDFKSEFQIKLENLKSFEERVIALVVICDLPGQRDENKVEHNVMLQCPWSRNEIQIPLQFTPPITASCRLHSSETRKFLQVIIKGTDTQLILSNANMQCDCKGVNLKDKNPPSKKNIVTSKGVNVSYLWEIEVEPLKAECELPVIKVNFKLDYTQHGVPESDSRRYFCKFDVQDYTTLFRIHAKVEPSELCRVGSVCNLNLKISKIQQNPYNDLMYEVLADQNTWAVCGRSAGVISMREIEAQSLIIEVLPLCAGFLPMPNIRLSKYNSAGSSSSAVGGGGSKSKNESQPKLQTFPPGQVYNSTKSIQIHVLASNNVELDSHFHSRRQ